MLQTKRLNFKSVLLTSLLISAILWGHSDTKVNKAATDPPDGYGGAFFALRGCHQLLHSDSGEFFSPDYLCSNPPLWCNWTIKVDPGKRIHLHLEDLTPDETCHLKQDQIHVDEPIGHLLGHKVLQKCWREAKFTSSSSTLHVVLLIGGWPTPPYRGFYGRYQAFGPLVVYNPREGLMKPGPNSGLSLALFSEYEPDMSSDDTEPESSDVVYDYYDRHLAMTSELPWELKEGTEADSEVGKKTHSSLENYSHVYQFTVVPTMLPSTQRIYRMKRATRGDVEEGVHADNESWSINGSKEAESGGNRTEVSEVSVQLPPPSEEPPTQTTESTHPYPMNVASLSDHRGSLTTRNYSDTPHLPGDHLFEITVEVNFGQGFEESSHILAGPLLESVQHLISRHLGNLHMLASMSSKRILRLHAGVLYILWLQIGQGPWGAQSQRAVQSAVHGLARTAEGFRTIERNATIMSVTIADVTECETTLVLCDTNADCTNQFGSYSCRCRPGFQDQSRLGSGGTICREVKAAGCNLGLSPETKGVYVLFFLLGSLILALLVVASLLYHRHHRRAFLVHCCSSGSISPHDCNNNHRTNEGFSCPPDSDLPPPPPPSRGHREGWLQVKERHPAVDLPLLRFSPLLPPDGYIDPQEGRRM